MNAGTEMALVPRATSDSSRFIARKLAGSGYTLQLTARDSVGLDGKHESSSMS